jgi:antitoxin ParD1/3/4
MAGRRRVEFPSSANGRARSRRTEHRHLASFHDINKYHKSISRRTAMATSYSIGKHFEDLIDSLIKDGRYATASEIIRDGLRLVEEREERRKAKLEALRAEIQKGIDSGPAEEVGDMFERIKAEGRKRLAAKNGK